MKIWYYGARDETSECNTTACHETLTFCHVVIVRHRRHYANFSLSVFHDNYIGKRLQYSTIHVYEVLDYICIRFFFSLRIGRSHLIPARAALTECVDEK